MNGLLCRAVGFNRGFAEARGFASLQFKLGSSKLVS